MTVAPDVSRPPRRPGRARRACIDSWKAVGAALPQSLPPTPAPSYSSNTVGSTAFSVFPRQNVAVPSRWPPAPSTRRRPRRRVWSRWLEATPSRTSSARAEKSIAGTVGRRGDARSGKQIPYSFRPPPQPTYVADSRFTGPRGRLRRGSESQTTSIRRRPTAEGVRPSRRRFQYRPLL